MKMIKHIALLGILTSLLPLTAIANVVNVTEIRNSDTELSIDMSNIRTTRHEIALMDVLSEICPPMLNKEDHANFYNAYNSLLAALLPTIDDPKAAMQYLSTQQDYQQVLESIRIWTMGFSASENKALCEEMAGKNV